MLEEFAVRGLHGDRDISFSFSDPATILVSDNGSGKTTALSLLYGALSGDLGSLLRFEFDMLEILVSNGRKLVFKRSEFDEITSFSKGKNVFFEDLRSMGVKRKYISSLLMDGRRGRLSTSNDLVQKVSNISGFSSHVVVDIFSSWGENLLDESDVFLGGAAKKFEELNRVFSCEVIYFPTYRRVEDELSHLELSEVGTSRNGHHGRHIHFGMKDVQKRFVDATEKLRSSAAKWHAEISGRMLSQLIDGIGVSQDNYELVCNREILEIVMGRVGGSISDEERGKILEVVGSEKVREKRYEPLVYFMSKLVEIYESQKDVDAKIKKFCNVTGKYLRDKNVVYDEKSVSIKVVDDYSGTEISLESLSSGEKQMMSIFSRLYLGDGHDVAVIIDEPELSLSIEWQMDFLPDMLDSGACKFLVAATHSPFIFENRLDVCATDLKIERSTGGER